MYVTHLSEAQGNGLGKAFLQKLVDSFAGPIIFSASGGKESGRSSYGGSLMHHELLCGIRCAIGAALAISLADIVAAGAPVPSGTVITIAGNGMAGFSGDGGP